MFAGRGREEEDEEVEKPAGNPPVAAEPAQLISQRTITQTRFRTARHEVVFQFTPPTEGEDFISWLESVLWSMLKQCWVGAEDPNHVGFEVVNIDTPRPFNIMLRPKSQVNSDMVLDLISK